jgi:hypothetical protein
MKTSKIMELTACEMEAISGGFEPDPPRAHPLRRLIRILLFLILGPRDRAPGGGDGVPRS